MFEQQINMLTGQVEWVAVLEELTTSEAKLPGMANSLYLDMLTDKQRNSAYRDSIRQAIKPGSKLVDIGTGTGFLAMMAAQAMLQTGMPDGHKGMNACSVTACEVYPPILQMAQHLLTVNSLSPHIQLLPVRSDEVVIQSAAYHPQADSAKTASTAATALAEDLVHIADLGACSKQFAPLHASPETGTDSDPLAKQQARSPQQAKAAKVAAAAAAEQPLNSMHSRADVIVTEIFDSELLGEGILPTMRHAVQHLLQPGGIVIPASAIVYGQLVQCSILAGPCDPDSQQRQHQQHQQQQGECHRPSMHALHVDPLYPGHLKLLSQPFQIFAFDFANPPERGQFRQIQVQAQEAGSLHALVMWWELQLDPAGSITLDTAPAWVKQPCPGPAPTANSGPGEQRHDSFDRNRNSSMRARRQEPKQEWRDHWKQCWTTLQPVIDVGPGSNVRLQASHDDSSISVALDPLHLQFSGGLDLPGHKTGGTSNAQTPLPQQARTPALDCMPAELLQGVAASHSGAPKAERHLQAATSQQTDTPDRQMPLAMDLDTLPDQSEPAGAAKAMTEIGCSPNRCWQLKDAARLLNYTQAVQHAVAAENWKVMHHTGSAQQASLPQAGADSNRQDQDRQTGSVQTGELQQDWDGASPGVTCIAAGAGLLLPQTGANSDDQDLDSQTGPGQTGVLQQRGASPGVTCFAAGAGLHLILAAAACDAVTQVICLQDSPVPQQALLQAAAAAGLLDKLSVADAQQVLGHAQPGQLLQEVTAGPVPPAQVFLTEPFYTSLESQAPWTQLRCWHQRDALLAAGLLQPSHSMLPCQARLCGVGASLPQLWRTRAPLTMEEGVNLAPCNAALGALENAEHTGANDVSSSAPVLTRAVWQCGGGYQELTERFEIMLFDFQQPLAAVQGRAQARVTSSGTMHAIVTWMEYRLHPDSTAWLSCGPEPDGRPGYDKQAIHLLAKPQALIQKPEAQAGSKALGQAWSGIEVSGTFDEHDGDIILQAVSCPPDSKE